MLAQKRHQVSRSVARKPKKRKRVSLIKRFVDNRMACVLLAMVMICFVLSVYVSAYARAMENGYHKSELLTRLREAKMENESLKLTLEELQQPERLEAFADANGMCRQAKIAYLTPGKHSQIARHTGDEGIR